MTPTMPDQGSGDTRSDALRQYAPTIRYLAERFLDQVPASVTLDDLLQAGALGLLDALAKFDPQQGTTLKTYAEHRIRGAMLDWLRQIDWVPRSVRQKARTLEHAYAGLAQALGRQPQEEEVAASLGLRLETVQAWLQTCRPVLLEGLGLPLKTAPHRFEAPGSRGLVTQLAAPDPTPEQVLEAKQGTARLGAALDALPDQQRLVLSLYYLEELTMKEVGRVLGLSESRVSQLHTQALLYARLLLARDEHQDAA